MSEGVSRAGVSRAVPADAGDRGRLDVDLGVVRRVAEHAADTTPGAARATPEGRAVSPRTRARVSGQADVVDVRLELALAYPLPVRRVVDAVRAQVAERLRTLTGYTLRRLDVSVEAFVALPDPAPPADPEE